MSKSKEEKVESAGHLKPSLGTDLIAGLAVFASMSYVAFANPLILQDAGVPAMPVFYATCLMAAIASFFSGVYAKAPAALAPGLALSTAIATFLTSGKTDMGWEIAFDRCAIAGAFLVFTSVTDWRRKIVDLTPRTIMLAVTGAIGAVLAHSALRIVEDSKSATHHDANLTLFGFGLFVIYVGYILLRGLAVRIRGSGRLADFLDILGRSSFVLSVIAVAALAHWKHPEIFKSVSGHGTWLWLETTQSFADTMSGLIRYDAPSLVIFILFILYADIVGSPYHMALDEREYVANKFDAETETQIRKSFHVDSFANILAPLVGTSPVVYYAENFAGRVVGGRGPWVALVPAILFLALAVVGYVFATDQGIQSLVPAIAVAPVLFVVGLIIISKSLSLETPIPHPAGPDGKDSTIPLWQQDFLKLGFRLPAAIAIVVTAIVDFATGIACGIISYTLFSWLIPRDQAKAYEEEVSGAALAVFMFIACVSMLFKFVPKTALPIS